MADCKRIGKRIKELRKYICGLSRRELAASLGLPEDKLRRIERGEQGSGVEDADQLAVIAQALGTSAKILIEGPSSAKKQSPKASGGKSRAGKSQAGDDQSGKDQLGKGRAGDDQSGKEDLSKPRFRIKTAKEDLSLSFSGLKDDLYHVVREHTKIKAGRETVAAMTCLRLTMQQHIYPMTQNAIRELLPPMLLDYSDTMRTLNPYWALYEHQEWSETEDYFQPMVDRMELLEKEVTEPILYVESAYVREEYRRQGVFRFYLDSLRADGDCTIWLNLQPVSELDRKDESRCFPSFDGDGFDQIRRNGKIAERLGFTVDPLTHPRQILTPTEHFSGDSADEEPTFFWKTEQIHKCAYMLSESAAQIIADDREIATHAALVQVRAEEDKAKEERDHVVADFRDGILEGYYVHEDVYIKASGNERGMRIACFAARNAADRSKFLFGAGILSVFEEGLDNRGILERYDSLNDMMDSKYFDEINDAYRALRKKYSEEWGLELTRWINRRPPKARG